MKDGATKVRYEQRRQMKDKKKEKKNESDCKSSDKSQRVEESSHGPHKEDKKTTSKANKINNSQTINKCFYDLYKPRSRYTVRLQRSSPMISILLSDSDSSLRSLSSFPSINSFCVSWGVTRAAG